MDLRNEFLANLDATLDQLNSAHADVRNVCENVSSREARREALEDFLAVLSALEIHARALLRKETTKR